MKTFLSRILSIVIGILCLFLLFTLWNGLFGNPVSAWIDTGKIRTYVAKTYPYEDFIVNKASYDMKDSCYSANVYSPTSMDTIFHVSISKGSIRDDYSYVIENKSNTLLRLEDHLNNQVQDIIKKEFPYQMRVFGAKLVDVTPQKLTLDMPYLVQELPGIIEVTVWTSTEKPDYDILAQRMLELKKLLEDNDIPADRYSMNLEYPYHNENGELIPDNFDNLSVSGFPSEKLVDSSDLPRILKDYSVEKEEQSNQIKEAEMKHAVATTSDKKEE